MIEPIMYIGIGFLVAGLLVIGVIPLVHARAVRLTRKRLEAVTPMSMAEIQAEKDQLRAEFAMTTRRLEMSVEQMKAKTTTQLAEIGKKSEAVGRLRLELNEKTEAMYALEEREKQLSEDLAHTRKELAERTAALAATEQSLATGQAQIGELTGRFNDSSQTADSQRVELIALRAQVEALQGQIESFESELKELKARLGTKTSELDTAERLLVEERGRSDVLGNRINEIERQLIAQNTEAEILERRVQELNARADEQGRLLGEHEYAADRLRAEATATARKETDVRAEFTELGNRSRATIESLNAEKTLLESQLKQALEDRVKLERDVATLRRESETAFATERMENSLMRERISDVAAEVARLTSLMEGPGNPIETILSEGAHAGKGATGSGANGGSEKGSLTDRIRALQDRPGVPQASRA
jgi:uncharacterized coiled-coil protein SlyX